MFPVCMHPALSGAQKSVVFQLLFTFLTLQVCSVYGVPITSATGMNLSVIPLTRFHEVSDCCFTTMLNGMTYMYAYIQMYGLICLPVWMPVQDII